MGQLCFLVLFLFYLFINLFCANTTKHVCIRQCQPYQLSITLKSEIYFCNVKFGIALQAHEFLRAWYVLKSVAIYETT